MASGWIEELFVRPSFFFKYSGFEWMPVWSPTDSTFIFRLSSSLLFSLHSDCFTASAQPSFCLVSRAFNSSMLRTTSTTTIWLFAWAVCCYACLLVAIGQPMCGENRASEWLLFLFGAYTLLRFQVALVYIFAAIAKLDPDWLIHAQPLSIWLSARQDMPILGTLFADPITAYVMSWGGLLMTRSSFSFCVGREPGHSHIARSFCFTR